MLSQQVHRGTLPRRASTWLFFSGGGRSRMENVLGSQSCSPALLCVQVDICPAAPLCEPVELFKFKFFPYKDAHK